MTFGELLERHEREIFAYVLRLTGSRADADDLYQETFLAAFRGWPPPRAGNERAWLYKIATNKAIDRVRRARRIVPLDDFDLVELNEAFAPQVLAVLKDLPIPLERLNVNGGAIALGHPIGCTGTRIIVTLLYEMMRRKARRGLATLCVSGGMGMAMAIESMLNAEY